MKSSEFLLTLSVGVLILANGTNAVTIPWEQILAYAGICGIYTGGRSFVKSSEAKTDISSLARRVKQDLAK